MIDYYSVLGIRQDASIADIRAAYRRAAQVHHPDRGGSHERMTGINAAYEVLTNPQRRAEFDREREARLAELRVWAEEIDRQDREQASSAAHPRRARTYQDLNEAFADFTGSPRRVCRPDPLAGQYPDWVTTVAGLGFLPAVFCWLRMGGLLWRHGAWGICLFIALSMPYWWGVFKAESGLFEILDKVDAWIGGRSS